MTINSDEEWEWDTRLHDDVHPAFHQLIDQFVDGSEHTLEDVGQNFDVTRERIRQIEAKALRKLRHPSRSYRLKTFLEEI